MAGKISLLGRGVCAAVVCVSLVSAASAVTIDVVPVGDANNAGDWAGSSYGGVGADRLCGTVLYEYNIAKYLVTAGQYCEFLNAVAVDDTYNLYNGNMAVVGYNQAQINRTGEDGNYSYHLQDFSGDDRANRGVTYVCYGDAMRFANWMHNGQPDGNQDLTTTEDGAYYLNGATLHADLEAVDRKADWLWAVPNEDEWHKAGYYKGGDANAGYWDYPTQSDTAPTAEAPPGGTNSGNLATGVISDVGAYVDSPSAYGTFDQAGYLWEWNEMADANAVCQETGSCTWEGGYSHAAYRNPATGCAANESYDYGFRLVQVPEPASATLLLLGAMALLRRRRRK